MRKAIIGVFAHPDDEAFIVAGTLLQEVAAGTELHLICLTNGAAGTNPDNAEDLGAVRLNEWRKAGELIGAKSMHHLGYSDGQLNNADMINVAGEIAAIAQDVVATNPAEIEFMAFDFNGLTGHIDHIVASRAAALAFYRLKASDSRFARLRLACLPRELYPQTNTSWIFMEPGCTPEEIDETIDARNLQEDIIEVIQIHHSQRQDGEAMIRTFVDQLGMNYFQIKT
jgi:LmbE family N-acetylglucosaminyl deacetylase